MHLLDCGKCEEAEAVGALRYMNILPSLHEFLLDVLVCCLFTRL